MTDVQRARLKMRCNHRGMKEMDIILGKFADAELDALSASELTALEELIEENDQDLLSWVLGREDPPSFHKALIERLKAFHGISGGKTF